jgi:hypothetical protein
MRSEDAFRLHAFQRDAGRPTHTHARTRDHVFPRTLYVC